MGQMALHFTGFELWSRVQVMLGCPIRPRNHPIDGALKDPGSPPFKDCCNQTTATTTNSVMHVSSNEVLPFQCHSDCLLAMPYYLHVFPCVCPRGAPSYSPFCILA